MTRVRIVLLAGAIAAAQAPPAGSPLALVRAIELPRVDGRIDHLAFDAATNRLFVAALGNNTVEVVDTATGTHVRSLAGFREPQGIAVAPDKTLVVVAEGQGAGAQVVGASDLQRGKTIALGDDADNVRYDAAARTIYVGYGDGAIAAVSPADGRVLGEAAVGGHPESFQLESAGSRIFVNVPTARRITVVDRATMKPLAAWPVTAADANYPMALDEAGHRLFIGCRRPAKLLVYDTRTGKQIGAADIVGDTDDLFYDAARQRIYVVGGEGYIDVLDAQTPALTRIARVGGAPGARTALFVPADGRLYLAVPHRGAQRAEIRVFQAAPPPQAVKRPTVVFMCPHGAAKSVLASAYFQKLAKERGLNIRVVTAGTDPDAQVSPAVASHLAGAGYALPISKPQKIDAAEFESADVVISLGCDLTGLPAARGMLVRWDEVPGPGENFAASDAAIRARVVALIDELSRRPDVR